MVSLSELEKLKAQMWVIALNHGVQPHGHSTVETIARLKALHLTDEEREVLRKVCEGLEVDYDSIKPIRKAKGEKK